MTELTAVEVLALSALMEGRPMTSIELSRAVSDMGMHLDSGGVAVTVRSLVGAGMAERTPAASLGKYRITAQAGPGSPPAPGPPDTARVVASTGVEILVGQAPAERRQRMAHNYSTLGMK
jgi:hypothetical protein